MRWQSAGDLGAPSRTDTGGIRRTAPSLSPGVLAVEHAPHNETLEFAHPTAWCRVALNRQVEGYATSRLTSPPWVCLQTVRRVGGRPPRPLPLRSWAKPRPAPRRRTPLGNQAAGAGRALQLILVPVSSSSRRAEQAAKARHRGGESVRSLPDARLPLGRSRRGAARRDPGAGPEGRKCRLPGLRVPKSPADSAHGCAAANSSRVTANGPCCHPPSLSGGGRGQESGVGTFVQFQRRGRGDGRLTSEPWVGPAAP